MAERKSLSDRILSMKFMKHEAKDAQDQDDGEDNW